MTNNAHLTPLPEDARARAAADVESMRARVAAVAEPESTPDAETSRSLVDELLDAVRFGHAGTLGVSPYQVGAIVGKVTGVGPGAFSYDTGRFRSSTSAAIVGRSGGRLIADVQRAGAPDRRIEWEPTRMGKGAPDFGNPEAVRWLEGNVVEPGMLVILDDTCTAGLTADTRADLRALADWTPAGIAIVEPTDGTESWTPAA